MLLTNERRRTDVTLLIEPVRRREVLARVLLKEDKRGIERKVVDCDE